MCGLERGLCRWLKRGDGGKWERERDREKERAACLAPPALPCLAASLCLAPPPVGAARGSNKVSGSPRVLSTCSWRLVSCRVALFIGTLRLNRASSFPTITHSRACSCSIWSVSDLWMTCRSKPAHMYLGRVTLSVQPRKTPIQRPSWRRLLVPEAPRFSSPEDMCMFDTLYKKKKDTVK